MKINNLFELTPILKKISNSEINLRTSYSIAKFLYGTAEDLNFFQSKMGELLQKYGERDASGQFITTASGFKLKSDTVEESSKEVNEILDYTIDAPKLQIYYEDLSDIKISPEDLIKLMPYIVKN